MKNSSVYLVLLILFSGLFFSCEDEITNTFTYRTMMPVYLEMNDVRARIIEVEPPQPLDNPGKIYIYGDYLLINEPTQGIHILECGFCFPQILMPIADHIVTNKFRHQTLV